MPSGCELVRSTHHLWQSRSGRGAAWQSSGPLLDEGSRDAGHGLLLSLAKGAVVAARFAGELGAAAQLVDVLASLADVLVGDGEVSGSVLDAEDVLDASGVVAAAGGHDEHLLAVLGRHPTAVGLGGLVDVSSLVDGAGAAVDAALLGASERLLPVLDPGLAGDGVITQLAGDVLCPVGAAGGGHCVVES